MDFLIDYDNLPKILRRPGSLPDLCSRLLNCVAAVGFSMPQRCRLRLYGGWYDGVGFTRRAQQVSAEVHTNSASIVRWTHRGNGGACLVNIEMAYSLEVEPNRHLTYTLRTRPFGGLIQCDSNAYANCTETLCPVRHVVAFMTQQKCVTQSCTLKQADLLRKTEQKLVDTMLSSDLIFLATFKDTDLFVVSSDDDLWPGIRTALGLGASVALIHTQTSRSLPQDYTFGLVQNFKQFAI